MIEMSLDSQRFVEQLVASGRFSSPEAVIDEAVRHMRADFESNGHQKTGAGSPSEWCERFEAWAAGHRGLPTEADDSRESIYAGRE